MSIDIGEVTDTPIATPAPGRGGLVSRVSRLEWAAAAIAAVVLLGLAIIEPGILGAPVENGRTLAFTVGGTAVAALTLVVMLRLRVRPIIRLLLLGVPFVAVNWWLLSPFFVDEVVNDEFPASVAKTLTEPDRPGAADTQGMSVASDAPRQLGTGKFVGLTGHRGSGDAAFFALENGKKVLRLENFDIQNGPDLRLYVLPGAQQTDPGSDGVYLGELKGNVGNQTYDLPADIDLAGREWTVLVWCEAFKVEFVAATISVA